MSDIVLREGATLHVADPEVERVTWGWEYPGERTFEAVPDKTRCGRPTATMTRVPTAQVRMRTYSGSLTDERLGIEVLEPANTVLCSECVPARAKPPEPELFMRLTASDLAVWR